MSGVSTPQAAPFDHRGHWQLGSLDGTRLRRGGSNTNNQHFDIGFTAQLHDLLQLKQENAYLTTITKQITPYIRSIARVKERLEPR